MGKDVHSMNNCGCEAFVVWWKGALRLLLSLLTCLAIAGMTWAAGAKDKGPARISVLIATGMPGGTYYQVGLGMASLWTTRLRDIGIRVSAAISEGSMENIEAIRIADADMILVEDLSCSMAYKGTEYTKAGPAGTRVSQLCADTVHLLIRADKIESGTLEDLNGLTVATGLPDSGNRFD
jgi:TRAP transporter TAXI family solute receptor